MRHSTISASSTTAVLALALALSCIAAAPAFAFSGWDKPAPPACPRGYVMNDRTKQCVRLKAGVLPDGELVQQARALALAGRYQEALDVLHAVQRGDDPVALTYTGYSLRRMGQTEAGIALYHKALAIAPDNADTREYLGEGYVAAGRIDLARAELVKVAALKGRDSEQYRDLAAAIDGHGTE